MKDAKIAYYLNDKLLAADELLRPIELQAGEHILVAKRDGVEIQRWEFVVQLGRDDKDAKVEIKPGSSPKSKYPEDLLKNLNERAIDDNFPFLTPDGLSIYYAREGGTHGPSAIYHARRVAVKQPFGKPTRVFNGRHVAVTADECYAVVLAEGMPAPLLELKRASTNAPWGAPTPIAEFKLDWNMKSPWLAPDGLSLVFNRNRTVAAYPSKITELVIARRAKRQDPWGQVQLLPMSIDPKFDDAFTWARLSDDLKTVWFSIGGGRDTARLMTASRPDAQSSFGGYRNVELDGKPIQGQGAFYISATKELFWSQDTTGTKADRDLRMALLELPAADSDGWTPLFNGKDLTGWTIESGDAESWKVRDNAIVTTGTGGLADETWLLSEKAYGDCIVRMEFLAESASVNSGVAIRVVPGERPTLGDPPTRTNRPQHLQIEIFGTAKTGGKLETGTVLSGFGPEVVLKSNPLDKQKPAGEWNLMEIETRGQAIRVRLNGELVLDGSLDDLIDRGGLYPGLRRKIGRIGFQRLGGTVRFRNIRIKELASPEEAGFVPLFNGKDLTGWKTHPDQPGDWQVKDGLLIGRFSEPSNLFSQRGDYKRFHLRVEAKLNQDGDSGINFRSEYGLSFKGKLGTRYPLGYQAQMVHSHKLPTSSLTGSLAKIGQDWLVTVKEQLVRPGEWYLHEVIVDGKRIVIKVNGKTTADIPDDDPAFASGHLALQVTWPETTVVHFKKIEIKELPPDDGGFVPLFNGKDLTGWQGLVPINARKKMTPEQYQAAVKKANEAMQEHWIVKDGVLHYDGKNDNLQTVKDYGNFELYADWKIGPNGDSGIYLRGYPQVQIWDINRKSNTKKVGSGGLYNNLNNPSSALMVADNPIGEWNTFHIVMIDDKVTVKLNGKLVVDNTTLENHWERGLPLPARGPIELQHHGDQLWFKNIFIKELPDTPVQAPRDAKWVARHESFIDIAKKGDVDVLFLGDSITDGWRGESGKSVWDKAFGRLKPANFGIGGDRTEHLLWRIQNGELDGITPKVAVVLIGTNNTLNESAEQIAEGIGAIVHTIRVKSPTTKVLVLGIFPRGKTIPNALNNKIIEANKFIAKLDDGKNVKYLNIGQKFMKAGQIPDAIMYDHLQLTAAGYQIWADALTPTLRTMLGAGKK
jgi:lysophospholipase L1-like esterase